MEEEDALDVEDAHGVVRVQVVMDALQRRVDAGRDGEEEIRALCEKAERWVADVFGRRVHHRAVANPVLKDALAKLGGPGVGTAAGYAMRLRFQGLPSRSHSHSLVHAMALCLTPREWPIVRLAIERCYTADSLVDRTHTAAGESILHCLCMNPHMRLEHVQWVCTTGRDAGFAEMESRQTDYGATPVHLAAACLTDPDAVLYLAERCPAATVESRTQPTHIPPALHCALAFSPALSLPLVQGLVRVYPEALHKVVAQDNYALHCCCKHRGLTGDVLQFILEEGPKDAASHARAGQLWPMHLLLSNPVVAQDNSLGDLVEPLLLAFPHVVRCKNCRHLSPIMIAAAQSWVPGPVMQRLLEEHPRSALGTDTDGNLPIHRLLFHAAHLALETVEAFFGAHPHCSRVANRAGALPLHAAAGNASTTAAILLMVLEQHLPAAAHENQAHRLPLHLFVRHNKELDPAALRILVDAHPEAVAHVAENDGLTSLHHIVRNPACTADALGFLLDHEQHQQVVSRPSQHGLLPLHLMFHTDAAPSLETVRLLLDEYPFATRARVARSTLGCNKGEIPLHLALRHRHITPAIVELLLEADPESVRVLDGRGCTPWHHLAQNPNLSGLKLYDPVATAARAAIVRMIVRTTDRLFAMADNNDDDDDDDDQNNNNRCSGAKSSQNPHNTAASPPYQSRLPIPHPEDHPLSVQGRLRAGVRVATRGVAHCFQWQGGCGKPAAHLDVLDHVVRCGHRGLFQLWHSTGASVVLSLACPDETSEESLGSWSARLEDALSTLLSSCSHTTANTAGCSSDNVALAREVLAVVGEETLLEIADPVPLLALLLRAGVIDDGLVGTLLQLRAPLPARQMMVRVLLRAGEQRLEQAKCSLAGAHRRFRESAVLSSHFRELLEADVGASGSLAVCEWAWEHGLLCIATHSVVASGGLFGQAARAKAPLPVVEFLFRCLAESDRRSQRLTIVPPPFVDTIAANGQLDVLCWLHAHRPERCTPEAMSQAAWHAHGRVVEWLHRHRNSHCRPDTLHVIVDEGRPTSLRTVEYLVRHGLVNATPMDTSGAVHVAEGEPELRPDILAFLRRAQCSSRRRGEVDVDPVELDR